jgi:hypothetical protein
MNLNLIQPRKALNKAFLKVKANSGLLVCEEQYARTTNL